MKQNVGGIDKILRIVVGLALIVSALLGYSVLGWIGVIPLITGIFGWCPAYSLLGFKTCPLSK